MILVSRCLALFVGFCCVSGCGNAPPHAFKNTPDEQGESTLYERLGGSTAIYAIADNLTERTLADPRVNLQRMGHPHQWAATPDHIAELKMYLAQYFGMIADGPPLYEGKNLLDVHRGMKISEAEWYAFMDNLKAVLAASQIKPQDQNDLLSRIAASHDVIVDQ